MIDFCKYETMKLGDIAKWERAKKGFVYPAGCTIIQVSATKGEVHYLTKKSEVEPKYVVVFPVSNINSRYMNIIIEKNIEEFCLKYQTGLNIMVDAIQNIKMQLHGYDTQLAVVKMFEHIERKEIETNYEISALQDLKAEALSKMFI